MTINELEDMIYEFAAGVLPTLVDVKEQAFGWTVRFRGCALQKDPLHIDVLRRNECWIGLERAKTAYRYPAGDDGSVLQEMEFTYGITLESKQTNFLLNPAMYYAARMTAHREGYPLFDEVGISQFEIVSQSVIPTNNNSVFIVNLILRLRAVINFSDIKTSEEMNSGTLTVYDKEKEVYTLSIEK